MKKDIILILLSLYTAGNGDSDIIKIAMAEGAIKDIRSGISKITLNPDYVGLESNFMIMK